VQRGGAAEDVPRRSLDRCRPGSVAGGFRAFFAAVYTEDEVREAQNGLRERVSAK